MCCKCSNLILQHYQVLLVEVILLYPQESMTLILTSYLSSNNKKRFCNGFPSVTLIVVHKSPDKGVKIC